jgi:DNA-directed RNA polymerase subunit RPC12/RpoP
VSKFEFSRDLTFHITCPHCGVRYDFDHKIEVKRDADGVTEPTHEMIQSANAELDELEKTHGGAVVKCPSCKKLGPGMMKRHLMNGALFAGWIIVCLIGAQVVMWVAESTGSLFWMLGLLALAGAGIGAFTLLAWMFGAMIEKGRLPTQEERQA